MASNGRVARALGPEFGSPDSPQLKTPTARTTHDVVMQYDFSNLAVPWFYSAAELLELEATPNILETTDRLVRSALSPVEGSASPGTCMEALEAVKTTLKRRRSERIKEAEERKRAAAEAREKAIAEANARAAEERKAFRAEVVARVPKYSHFEVDNALRRVA